MIEVVQMQKNRSKRRAFLMPQPIGYEIRRLLSPFVKSQGFCEARIILDWPQIVGLFLSEQTSPQKISFPKGEKKEGTLFICVTSAIAPEISHMIPQIIERINGYFGYGAVQKIVLKHGNPVLSSLAKTKVVNKPLNVDQEKVDLKKLNKLVQEIEDDNLKNALISLGKSILR